MSDPNDPRDLQRRALRASLRAQRDALGPRERMIAADGLSEQLEQLAEFLTDERVAGYWAVRGELSLHRVLPPLAARGQRFHLPVLNDDATLGFAPWKHGDPVQPNRYGIPEPAVRPTPLPAPETMQLVLVPLVAFDRRGNRLGSGAGYYDRSFAFLKQGERPREPLLVGIAYAFQEVDILPREPWDVPLDFVCTERELIECA